MSNRSRPWNRRQRKAIRRRTAGRVRVQLKYITLPKYVTLSPFVESDPGGLYTIDGHRLHVVGDSIVDYRDGRHAYIVGPDGKAPR